VSIILEVVIGNLISVLLIGSIMWFAVKEIG